MSAARMPILFMFALHLFLQASNFCFPQSNSYPLSEWVKKLSDKSGPVNSGVVEVLTFLSEKDTLQVIVVLNELERKGATAGNYFTPRFNLLKASWLYNTRSCASTVQVSDIMKKALYSAYETNNDSLISAISWYYGSFMFWCQAIEPAAIFCLNSLEMDERKGIKTNSSRCGIMGDILYKTRDYGKAIYYNQLAIARVPDTADNKAQIMSWNNTIALCWQKSGYYDSAFHYYNIALRLARELKNSIWVSIISGNIGQVYYLQGKYELAKPLLEFDYRESKGYGETASAANSLQWVARINMALGKKDSALMQIREALKLIYPGSELIYQQNVYYAAAELYMAFGIKDSMYKYSRLYNQLRDADERAVANSRMEIARIKLDNLQNELTIKNLNKEKETEELKRNLVIVFIVLIAIIGFLILNRQKQKLKYKQQLAIQQKEAAEKEIISAKQQLNAFRQNIVEKTNLIEKLQQQAHDKEVNLEQQQIIDELTHQTILTENDWDEFKRLFEKIHPGFFIKLKEKAADITLAEQRMAALTRLHLTTKQMASMLGISVDSVHKTRQRLRQRLHIGADINLEETIAEM